MEAELKHRHVGKTNGAPVPAAQMPTKEDVLTEVHPHPSGEIKHSRYVQWFRGVTLVLFLGLSCVAIFLTQLIGSPLYLYDQDMFYAYMALTKQSFALVTMSITQWWGPTVVRISGDTSVAGQIHLTKDGRVEFSFPERIVLVANHQIYTDWLYLWWVGYANSPQMHGYIYIILKESLKHIPILGHGMMFYGFIFMSRKMAVDQPRLAHRLQKLKQEHTAPDGSKYLNPMWLLLFPEGTTVTKNGRSKSAKWSEKTGYKDPEHVLLPRSTGTLFCLRELKGTVDYVYDCTVAYEGIPRGQYGEDYFGLATTYLQGRPPPSVNFYWRRWRVDDIPLEDAAEFDEWLRARWYEKDALMEGYLQTGRFPVLPMTLARKAMSKQPFLWGLLIAARVSFVEVKEGASA
ncbi:unnamed protein product [Parascedosporium putredinis]|uniref:Phospholipid/glycerol acyltransferase domain-containing protein n=1 Tax=Parascedosporium putredinis TaxID=1442378 RepID=A0A9P1GY18_9PEZI|nr:unnamed protein product [Parascedosporium putredinis]CAI7991220.1 unnamed protein product [Parascedosporium putredinis]